MASATAAPAELVFKGLDSDPANGLHEEWFFAPRPVFLRSDAYEILRLELMRYLSGEVPGRSFLIAGYRGAGKTALVRRVVEDVQRDAIVGAIARAARGVPHTRGSGLQRPFLVKLNGAALVPPDKAAPNGGDVIYGPAPPAPVRAAEQALQQVTIALYRALAAEIASAYAMHARALDFRPPPNRRDVRDLPELAGQVTLDLDQAPDIAALRAAWHRLGKLSGGVLWPGIVGKSLADSGLSDRGVREIVALATANQAFQACTGTVEAKRTSKDGANREETRKTEARADAKDLLNRVLGLAVGAFTGAALLPSQDLPVAVAAGLATGVVGTAAMTWSTTRSRRSERGLDYSFVIDLSVNALERDLPLVVERIREAGLAPVFIIDELDKVPRPREVIDAIIRRLKNITTDYGFFCFLTGREYFDEIEHAVEAEAFPNEHTYFSHRLLICYPPREMSAFVRGMWQPEDPPTGAGDPGAWALVCYILHRSRLSTIDIMRAITRLSGADGRARVSRDDLLGEARFAVPVAVQLAVEHMLRRRDITARTRNDPAFAQWSVDAMYMISRAWRRGEPVTIDPASLRAYLVRQGRIEGKDEAARLLLLSEMLPGDMFDLLLSHVVTLADLLCDFRALQAELNRELADPAAALDETERRKLLALTPAMAAMPVASTGLLRKPDPNRPVYEFLLDDDGVERIEVDWPTVQATLRFVEALLGALRHAGLAPDELVRAGILPSTVVEARLQSAVAALTTTQAAVSTGRRENSTILLGFADIARDWSHPICLFAGLVMQLRRDASMAAAFHPALALAALRRVLPVGDIAAYLAGVGPAPTEPGLEWLLPPPDAPRGRAFLDGTTWSEAMEAQRARLAADDRIPAGDDPTWSRWTARIAHWTNDPRAATDPPVTYLDVLRAVTGPAALTTLGLPLSNMTLADWSVAAAAAFAASEPDRLMLFDAIARVLGFSPALLARLRQESLPTSPLPPGEGVILLLYEGPGQQASRPPGPPRRSQPVFAVPLTDLRRHTTLVEELYRRGMVEREVLDE